MAPQDLVFFVFAGLAAWFLLVRPQRARAKSLQDVRAALAVGSRVMTTAGLHATVAALEGDTILLEIAPGVRSRFATAAVVRVLEDGSDGVDGADSTVADDDAPLVVRQGEPPAG